MPRYAPKTLSRSLINRIVAADRSVQGIVGAFLKTRNPTRREQLTRAQEIKLILDRLDRDVPLEVRHLMDISYERANRAGRKQAKRAVAPARSNLSEIERETVSLLSDALTGRIANATNKLGRQAEDAFRRHALRGAVNQAFAPNANVFADRAAERLRRDGITAFVDSSNRRWTLENYSKMAIHTATSEAQNRAIMNVAMSRGLDLVEVDKHAHEFDVCSPYDGKIFSISGKTPGYPVLKKFPPFHPNCEHFLSIPAAAFDLRYQLRNAA